MSVNFIFSLSFTLHQISNSTTVGPCTVRKSIQKKHRTVQNRTVQGTCYLVSDLKISQIRTTLSPQYCARDTLFSKWSKTQIRTTLSPQHCARDMLLVKRSFGRFWTKNPNFIKNAPLLSILQKTVRAYQKRFPNQKYVH